MKGPYKTMGMSQLVKSCPLEPNETQEIEAGGKEEIQAQGAHTLPFPRNHLNQSPMGLPMRRKHDAVPPHLLNADPLAQIIGTETVADVVIDDAEACALLDSGATADLMTQAYAKARNFDIRPMTELSDHFINLRLAVTLSGYVKYNLQIPRISSYNSDQVALVAEDHTAFSREVPLTIGTKTEDTILKALKEGEIKMLDSIWKRVKNNWSLSKLQEEVKIWEAVVRVAHATSQRPPEFKDHMPYSNRGMEDLLKLNEIANTTRTEIIPARSNKTHLRQTRTPLVLTGAKMNVMIEPLHQMDECHPPNSTLLSLWGCWDSSSVNACPLGSATPQPLSSG